MLDSKLFSMYYHDSWFSKRVVDEGITLEVNQVALKCL